MYSLKLLVFHPGEVDPETLMRRESKTQREPLYVVIYGMSLYVLVDKILGEYPGFNYKWYDDNFIMKGTETHLKPVIETIEAVGNAHGLFIEHEKSKCVWDTVVSEEATNLATDPLDFIHWKG